MRNILYYDNISFVKGGFYDAEQYLVSLNEDIIKTRVSFLKKYVELSDRDVEKFNQIAEKKTRMHEIGHGLQAQFVDGNPPQDIIELYQKLIKSICNKKKGKYLSEVRNANEIRRQSFSTDEIYKHVGLHYGSFFARKNPQIRTYREIDGFDLIDEIFNESESLEMADANIQIKPGPDLYDNIKNFESSNFAITKYGYILKAVIGERDSFVGMYLNPSEMIEKFNAKYNSNFQKEFNNGKTAYQNVIEKISGFKENGEWRLEEFKFQSLLVQCFEQDLEGRLQFDLEETKRSYKAIKENITQIPDKNLRNKIFNGHNIPDYYKILNRIKARIDEYENSYHKPILPSDISNLSVQEMKKTPGRIQGGVKDAREAFAEAFRELFSKNEKDT